MAKAQKYIGGETLQRKNLYREGVHRTFFLERGNYRDGDFYIYWEGGTKHNLLWGGGLVGRVHHVTMEEKQSGWVGWSMIL